MRKPWVILIWEKKKGSDVRVVVDGLDGRALRFATKAEAEREMLNIEMPSTCDRISMTAVSMLNKFGE